MLWMFFSEASYSQTHTVKTISGTITDASNHPLEGATVSLLKSKVSVFSDTKGAFVIRSLHLPDTLMISYIGFESYILVVDGSQLQVTAKLTRSSTEMESVVISTGFEKLPRERATGSFSFINNDLLNRSVSTNVLSRIENLAPGILFNRGDAAGTDALLVRGRSTIYADAQPMIVVDNFPYEGDIGNINPNDVENITVLKDAAAASIWGARAANGVIVITTRRGQSQKPKVELNVNTTFQARPDIYNVSTVSSPAYIALEKFLYEEGHYSSTIDNPQPYPLSPVVAMLVDRDNGVIAEAEANQQIEALKLNDVRKDISKYFYQPLLNQQYNINVNGSAEYLNYYLSAGYDHNKPSLVGESYQRINIQSLNTFKITNWWKLEAGIKYLGSKQSRGNNAGVNFTDPVQTKRFNPYASLVDGHGNPLPFYGSYRKSYLDTVGQGMLLDWLNRPVEEISKRRQGIQLRDYLLNLGTSISILPSLTADIRYQYEKQLTADQLLHSQESFYTRNMINSFSQLDYDAGTITRPVPMGGIMDMVNTELTSHQGRAQLNYNTLLREKNRISITAGYEVRSLVTTSDMFRFYGYNEEHSTIDSRVDYVTYFPRIGYPSGQPVPNSQFMTKTTDRFLSAFANAAYEYDQKYILSASGRKDEANLFGVKTNQKGSPFWSAGLAWIASNESFYKSGWLPFLKLRATYGYNGNISRLASAYTTAMYNTSARHPFPVAFIQTPPNENLRWEKVRMTNLGLDFATRNKRLSGSAEYYWKYAGDLMAPALVDPTLGIPPLTQPSFFGNVASMKTRGLDVELHSINTNGRVGWTSSVIFSLVRSALTEYHVPIGNGGNYLGGNTITPVIGKPIYAMFSFPWGGLDGASGDPNGYLDGKLSQDYPAIMSSTPLDSMVYNGAVQPVYFGAIMNTVSWKGFSLSANISYKGGYVFRRISIDYADMFSSWNGHGDYEKRWQHPGDENVTHVPGMKYPADNTRDEFYRMSDVLVEKGDHIRLEDINLSYAVNRQKLPRLPFQQVRLFTYISNLGVLWKAGKAVADPYYNNTARERTRYSLGMQITF